MARWTKASQGLVLSIAALTAFSGLTPAQAVDPAPSGFGTDAQSTPVPLSTTDALKKKIEEAKALGIKVDIKDVKQLTTNYTGIEAAQKEGNDYQNASIKTLDEAITEQKALDKKYELAVEQRKLVIAENEKIDQKNKQSLDAFNAANAARDAAIAAKAERDKKAEEIQKSNDAALKAYADAVLKYNEEFTKWSAQVADINKNNTATNAENAKRLTPLMSAIVDAADDASRKKAVDAYNAEVAKIEAENKKVEADNTAKMDQYNKDLAAAEKARADAEKKLADVKAENARLKTEFEAAQKKYEEDLAAYNAAIADIKDARDAQLNSDPYTAIQPSELFVENPFSMNPNPNNLISISQENAIERGIGTNWYDMGSNYNSETIHKYQVNPGSVIRAEYGNVATDKKSGRALNVRMTYDNFHVVQNNVDLPQFGVPAEAGQSVQAFTNYMDAVAIQGITYYQAQFDFYYADTGESYDKPYYITTGSLHGVKDTQIDQTGQVNPAIPVDPTGHYEFSGPVSGVRSSMINPGSIIEKDSQPINTHEGELGRAFMIRQGTDYYMDHGRTTPIGDESNEALTVLGVTYLVDNNARLAFGVSSAVPGADYDPTINWYNGGPVGYNHVMLSADTVAPLSARNIPDKPEGPNPPNYLPEDVTIPELPQPPVLKEWSPANPVPGAPTLPKEPVTQVPPPDVEIPTVPPLEEIPRLDVPDEPEREYTAAVAGFAELTYLPTDVRVAKTAVDMDASDGEVSWLVEGGNWGPGTATNVVVKDTFGRGVKDIKLSDLKVNGGDANSKQSTLTEDGATFEALKAEDRFSFVVTASVDPNVDNIQNAVGITSPDDPKKGQKCEDDPQLNNRPDEDTDGCDLETSRVIQKAQLKIHKEMTSFDEETLTATYKVTGGNFGAIAHDVVIEDFGGAGIIEARVKSFQAFAPGTAPTEPTLAPTAEATVEPTEGATNEAAVAADLTPVGEIEIPDLVAPQPSESAPSEPAETATPEVQTRFGEGRGNYDRDALVIDAKDQPSVVGADVTILDDYKIEGNKVYVDAMGKDETFEMIVEVSLEETARFIDNKVGVTSPSDPNAKGKDGSQPNDDVPSDNDGWDIAENELDRPADLRVNKLAVDGDASDGKVTFRVEGANVGVGDSPMTDILDEGYEGLLNPVVSNVMVDGQPADTAEFFIHGVDARTGEAVEATTSPTATPEATPSAEATTTPAATPSAEPTIPPAPESQEQGEKVGIQVANLKAGQTYTYDITFDVDRSAEKIYNAAAIDSPKDPVNRDGDIQENEDIPGDEDQRDQIEVPVTPSDLRVNKEAIDGDASDGIVSYRITGANFGPGDSPDTDILDSHREGLIDPVISKVMIDGKEAPTDAYVRYDEASGKSGIRVNNLQPGSEASFEISFKVDKSAEKIFNAASVGSPFDPAQCDGEIQENDTLANDTDGCDIVETEVTPIDLRVNKSVVDADTSDGKVSFLIEGVNFGKGTASDVELTDAEYVGLENPVISDVKVNGAAVNPDRYEVLSGDASGVRIDQLASDETASYMVEFDVIEDATEISNAARITSPDDPVDPNKEIQENPDLPSDDDQQDKVNVPVLAPELRVDKKVVDDDASDGKVSFVITGANFGEGIARETTISDEDYVGLTNPVISDVEIDGKAADPKSYTVAFGDVNGITLDLNAGQVANYTVTFDVEEGAREVSNAAAIDSPDLPVDRSGEIQENDGVQDDVDQRDKVKIDIPEPIEPGVPAEPADPVDPAPETPAEPAPVKGTWGTGAAGVAGIGLSGLFLISAIGYGIYRFRGRSAE